GNLTRRSPSAPSLVRSLKTVAASHRTPHPRCPRATHTSPIRHACRDCHVSRFSPQLAILPRDPALAASPPAGYTFRVGRSGYTPPLSRPLQTDNVLAKRRRAAYSSMSASRISRGLHAASSPPVTVTAGVSGI